MNTPRPPMTPQAMVRRALNRDRRDVISPFGGRGLQYGQSDPNCFPVEASYSEGTIFNGAAIALDGPLAASAVISRAAGVPQGFQQNDHFTINALVSFANQNRQALNDNTKRIALTIQNQGAANLYFSLGAFPISGGSFVGVKLTPGQGYTFDNRCVPCDALFYAWDAAGGVGIVMEGTRDSWPEVHA